ncbi:amino acid adenylation domain-containing protein [Tistlia consotensis]|uniref:Amino acid adenylation domain-containing protein n=1 Tax=Tistlia consotensis USBA 355 TaxID=560819 RepID=A0A1Y6BHA2_9PROT|nr:hybrid non-ribosomal peptide synthetase/type I polyketide synthase [Tistlia consotensis]SMF03952.1 amino acid adenylation domain-containing protein [Tistlia consotensis USBA 355]SNR54147.1 amino acid adenylation domain-containing protein [Tistlia consotensis]
MSDQVYVFPASPAQRRLWFLDQLQGPSPAYSVIQALEVRGALDRAALSAAFRALVARHEILRTALVAVDGEPLQAIEPELDFVPAFETLEEQPAAGREAAARRRLSEVLARPFDLAQAPLMRVLLLRLEPERHLLGIALHHAVCDGQSLAVLVEELAHLYRRACGAPLAELPEPPIQYADYAAWLEDSRDAAGAADSLAFWTERLRDAPPLGLPLDHPAPALLPPDGARHDFVLPAELAGKLEAFARERGATPFMLWLALWAATLGRTAGQADFCLGVPVAGRGRPELERLIGLFANTLALRLDLSGAPALGGLLERLRATVLEGFARQDTPFETLVETLKVPRAGGRSPLFQSLFALHEDPLAAIALPGLELRPLDLPQVGAKVELTLELTRRADGGLDGRLEYSSVLFEAATARRLAEALRRTAEDWLADPTLPLHVGAQRPATGAGAGEGQGTPSLPPAGPATPLEETLAGLWRELLGVEAVGRADGFFDLGGHSLLACRLVARLRQRVPVELPVAAVFEAPSLAGMAGRVQQLLDAETSGAGPAEAAIEPAPAETTHPLSPAQTRLWFLQQLESQSPAYALLGALEIEGSLDVELLRRVLQALEQRHASLRARFRLLDGEPVQVTGPPRGLALPVVDLEPLPGFAREEEVRRIGRAEARQPLDLAEGPPIRLRLLRHSARRHVLLVTLHHIVADGWSLELLLGETAALYRAFAEELDSPLPPLGLQYGDYAAWQRRALDPGRVESLLGFWRERLAGLPPLELPTDRPRPPVQTAEGARHDFRLEPALSAGVARLAAETGTTRFQVLLAVFAALLARYSGQEDFAVGVPASGRERPETQELVGCFVNTLVLRFDLSDAPGFRELVARVRGVALEAQAHQDLPFERLVEGLALERDLSRNALFQVLFSYQAASAPPPEIPGLALRPLEIDPGVAQFDLALYLDERDGGLAGGFVYRTDLYDSGSIVRLEGHFRRLLEAALAEPGTPFDRLPLLTAEERQRLADWNDTRVDYELPPRLIDLIDAQVARSPQAVAAVSGDERLSYGELAARANRLAGALAAAGAGPGRPVGVCLERSLSLIVALTAILRTGAPFLPLDPEQPAARLGQILEDAGPSLVVTTPALAGSLPEGLPWLDVAAEGEPLEGPPAVGADDPAYLLFTSGSTGRPKGALNSQRGILNRLAWMQQYYPIGPRDRVLQKTPYGFDVSVWEFFWPLIAGARLVFARPGGHRDPDYLAGAVARHGITVLHFVPSMLEAFLPAADPVACASLRRVFLSGEALSAELERRFFARGLTASLHNLYGPTEAAIDVSTWDCLPPGGRRTPPIGYAAPNCRLHILDAHGQPVPVGVPGELFLGGVQVGLGYLGRPELTAERFLPDPFAGEAGEGARLYRTGDRARRLADGAVEFLGRLDFQVKLRGQRIELGEIEAVLLEHRGVRSAVATLWGDEPARQRLVAYVVPAADEGASKELLRRHLEERLPGYMVPDALVLLEALPLNASGKLDRRRLPPPERPARAGAERPLRESERTIAEAWCALLGLESVAADANFFEAGGTSLLLVQVHARLKARWPEVSLVELFRFPTVESLAAHLSPSASAPARAERPAPRRAAAAGEGIAIVAMACRFPGADDVEAFWRLLTEGREAIERLDEEELRAAGVPEALLADPRYVRAAAAPAGIDLFDAGFFGYSPAEAAELDPQGRLFLECAWQALERAGIDPSRPGGPVGVFAGAGLSGYALSRLAGQGGSGLSGWAALQGDPAGAFHTLAANDKDYLASRVAYKLGLTGPAVGVQTACSTSLVAVHLACRSLAAGECRTALAGGASISVPSRAGYLFQEGGVASADGHCRAFDAEAGGTVPAGGVGVVVLKRLADALADGDPIHAVIRGTAINNDGNARVGFTAPGVEGQAGVIAAAQEAAGVAPADIGYVEAHGTATPLGDLIEIGGLTRAFGRLGPQRTPAAGSVALGSAKTNIGHLDAAAGVAGLIKAALAVEQGLLPASLNFRRPNERLDLEQSPFFVNGELRAWTGQGRRRAGVSSFGIGGTNAHAVVEQAPERAPGAPARRWQLLPLSAVSAEALAGAGESLAGWLDARPGAELAGVAYTLQAGRRGFAERRFVVASAAGQAGAALRAPAAAGSAGRLAATSAPPVVLLFPGQGSQYPGMGAGLGEELPVWRETVERCLAALPEALALDLRQLVLEPAGGDGRKALLLRRTELAQPALFVVEVALARQLQAWGLRPAALLGHSLGELAAATVAGVFRLEEALGLVVLRGRLMQAQPPGAMLAVEAEAGELAPLLGGGLAVAALNAPAQTVVGGPAPEVEALAARLAEQGIASQALHTSHAFHGPSMAAVMAPFAEAVAAVERRAPELPVLSNLTGDWLTEEQALDPDYWARQLREPVRFSDALDTLFAGSDPVLLEVGPGRGLLSLVRQHPAGSGAPALLRSLPGPLEEGESERCVLEAVGGLWLAGAELDWRAVHAPAEPLKLALPGHPLDRKRHWLDAPVEAPAAAGPAVLRPGWIRLAETPPAADLTGERWRLEGAGEPLAAALRQAGAEVVGSGACETLLLCLPDGDPAGDDAPAVVPRLAALLAEGRPRRLCLVTVGARDLLGDEPLGLAGAAAGAAALVAAQELPDLELRSLDLEAEARTAAEAGRLLAALAAPGPRHLVLRHGRLWRAEAQGETLPDARLPEGAVVLITGGFGGVGLAIARRLAGRGARLVLCGRDGGRGRKAEREALAAAGATVIAARCDVADPASLAGLVARAVKRFGRLDAVVHAAGVAGEAAQVALAGTDAATAERLFRAKLAGTRALAEALSDRPEVPVLLCSSLSTVLGGLGFAAYAAANAVMDSLALRLVRDAGRRWLAVDWDGWRLGGDAPDGPGPDGLAPEVGAALAERLLASGLTGRLLVTATPLGPRLARWVEDAAAPTAAVPAATVPAEAVTPVAATPGFAAPRSGLEEAVAAIWREALGLPEVGVDDDFFALGGHSLLAVRMLARLQQLAGVPLSLRALLEAPSIARQARTIEALRWQAQGQEAMDRESGGATAGAGEEEGEI